MRKTLTIKAGEAANKAKELGLVEEIVELPEGLLQVRLSQKFAKALLKSLKKAGAGDFDRLLALTILSFRG